MSEHSPPPKAPTLPVRQGQNSDSPTRYADAARKNTTTTSKSSKHSGTRNASIVLYTNHQYDHLLTTDPALLAIARSQNPKSVIFNFQQLLPSTDIEDLLVKEVRPVIALNTRVSKQQHLLTEFLFTKPEHRQQAITDGIIVNGERIITLPHIAANTNLIKVNMYQLPVCDPRELTDELFSVLAKYGQVAQIRAYFSSKNHVFKGEATALLDISLLGAKTPKFSRFIHLESPFPAKGLIQVKGMPPYCGYCRAEGHYISKCNNLKEQRKNRIHPYTSCGDTKHISDLDVRCKNHTPAVNHLPPSPLSNQATTNSTESFNKKLQEFDTYMADHRSGTSMWDSHYAPTNISDDFVYHNHSTISLPSSAPSTPTSDWAFDHKKYLLLSQRLDRLHQEHQQQQLNSNPFSDSSLVQPLAAVSQTPASPTTPGTPASDSLDDTVRATISSSPMEDIQINNHHTILSNFSKHAQHSSSSPNNEVNYVPSKITTRYGHTIKRPRRLSY